MRDFFIYMKKQEKTFFVDNLSQELKDAKSIYLVDYSGLSVSMQQDLKKRLKEADAKMIVVKNTLLKLAGKKAKVTDSVLEDSILTGQTALILALKDPVSPLSTLAKFTKEFEIPKLKVGIVEGSFKDKEELDILSKLPGKDVLLYQTVGVIGSPIYGLLGTLESNFQKLMYILESKSKGGD